uniref:DUF29 domain-containing protein n=1 Tax=Candidatus Kentrum sp. UNK TaxID=2126344 RepID=A0A451AUN0_9GAMM|nr:MAG: protein of unknown function DUF29 [Candidatus Kentron sp. UNK]VFK69754.1 MAG: protein of unknown function DUF29 [Candidatus Kentron sp. UNK]
MNNWPQLSSASPYQTAVAIKTELIGGNSREAMNGLRELIEALARSEKRALKSQLVRLMLHIIKWKSQPERRSRSWLASIEDAREEIADIQEETPSLDDDVIRGLWDKAFAMAKRNAQAEMHKRTHITALSWPEVFEEEYEDSSEASPRTIPLKHD